MLYSNDRLVVPDRFDGARLTVLARLLVAAMVLLPVLLILVAVLVVRRICRRRIIASQTSQSESRDK